MPRSTGPFKVLGVWEHVLIVDENGIANTNSTNRATLADSEYRQRLLTSKIHRRRGTNFHEDLQDESVIHETVRDCETTNRLQYQVPLYGHEAKQETSERLSNIPHHSIPRYRSRQKWQSSSIVGIIPVLRTIHLFIAGNKGNQTARL